MTHIFKIDLSKYPVFSNVTVTMRKTAVMVTTVKILRLQKEVLCNKYAAVETQKIQVFWDVTACREVNSY